MIMRRLFRSLTLVCMLPLSVCIAHGLERKSEGYEALAAAAPPKRTPEQVAALAAWKLQVARQLERKKQYPAAARARREQGTVFVFFVVDRQGRLSDSRVLRSSGFATLDSASLNLVRQAQPFPPPPAELTALQFKMTVPVIYTLGRCGPLDRLFGRCAAP
jgi:TonB family protein